ncbi:MAG: copper chaperone [Gemmatimonadetes bacterium]|nr:MAG: copper chaperone [Gemmatimonadota bacterium]
MRTQLVVNDMSCGHCEKAIYNAINALEGVTHVEVTLKTKTVDVEHDLTPDALINAIEAAGYEEIEVIS